MDKLRDQMLNLPSDERIEIAITLYESVLNTNSFQSEELVEIEMRIDRLRHLVVADGDKH